MQNGDLSTLWLLAVLVLSGWVFLAVMMGPYDEDDVDDDVRPSCGDDGLCRPRARPARSRKTVDHIRLVGWSEVTALMSDVARQLEGRIARPSTDETATSTGSSVAKGSESETAAASERAVHQKKQTSSSDQKVLTEM